jgi:nitrous oxide reductase accessory protein NosL
VRRGGLLLALVAAAALLGACARRLAPEPLPLDRYNCARCGMMVSEIGDAAEYVSPKEDTRFYDDVGCAAADAGRVPIRGKFFVRADGGTKWLSAGEAFFAKTGERTPMGYGYFAFSTEAQAAARDAQHRALRWADLGKAK